MSNKGEVKVRGGFFMAVREEMKKVSWPSRSDATRLTIIVFAISLIVGLYVGIIDVLLAKILEMVTNA